MYMTNLAKPTCESAPPCIMPKPCQSDVADKVSVRLYGHPILSPPYSTVKDVE